MSVVQCGYFILSAVLICLDTVIQSCGLTNTSRFNCHLYLTVILYCVLCANSLTAGLHQVNFEIQNNFYATQPSDKDSKNEQRFCHLYVLYLRVATYL